MEFSEKMRKSTTTTTTLDFSMTAADVEILICLV